VADTAALDIASLHRQTVVDAGWRWLRAQRRRAEVVAEKAHALPVARHALLVGGGINSTLTVLLAMAAWPGPRVREAAACGACPSGFSFLRRM
jgi:hypothetical protein